MKINSKYKLDEHQKQFEEFVESIGYIRRVGSYFIIREDDGYINVRREFPSESIYRFYKNFYQGKQNPYYDGVTYNQEIEFLGYNCKMFPGAIEVDFNRVSDFKNFLTNYHKKQGRKLKLKQIENKTNRK